LDQAGALAALSGARVRRVDLPAPRLLAIALDAGCTIVVGTARSARGVGIVDAPPKGEPATALARKLRLHLEGGELVEVRVDGAAIVLAFRRGAEVASLACVFDGAEGALVLLDGAQQILHASDGRTFATGERFTAPPARVPLLLPQSLAELETAGDAVVRARAAADFEARRVALGRAVRRGLERASRRLVAIGRDLSASAEADTLRMRASLLLAHAHEVADDATEIVLLDESHEPPQRHTIALPREHGGPTGSRAAIAAAQKLFVRARKLDTGARIAVERQRRTEDERTKIAALVERVDAASDDRALHALAAEAHALGVVGARGALEARADVSEKKRRDRPEERVPYRRFVASGERPVFVGRGAADNDALTQKHARPQDLWLHARGIPGAHVVVPLGRGETCPPELLLDAATLAAHFSDARGEPIVDVLHAPKRFVRKPRRSAPGAVVVDREKVIALRLEPKRLARLLAAESLA